MIFVPWNTFPDLRVYRECDGRVQTKVRTKKVQLISLKFYHPHFSYLSNRFLQRNIWKSTYFMDFQPVLLFLLLPLQHWVKMSFFGTRKFISLRKWKNSFVNRGMHKQRQSVPNFVIIKLKPRPFHFYLKTLPSFTGRCTLYRTAAVELPLGSVRRKDEDLWTERCTSKNCIHEVNKTLPRKSLGYVAFRWADKLARTSS